LEDDKAAPNKLDVPKSNKAALDSVAPKSTEEPPDDIVLENCELVADADDAEEPNLKEQLSL
ncbi:unnamed protein product, partial [Ilex paraguariensis]